MARTTSPRQHASDSHMSPPQLKPAAKMRAGSMQYSCESDSTIVSKNSMSYSPQVPFQPTPKSMYGSPSGNTNTA
jgi:hypothetical protein